MIVIFCTLIPLKRQRGTVRRVITLAKNNQLEKIEVNGDNLTAYRINGETFKSKLEKGDSITSLLLESGVEIGEPGVEIYSKGSSGLSSFFGLLLNFLPLIFFGGLILFMMRQAQGSNNQTMSFGAAGLA